MVASLGLALIAAGWSVGLALRFGSLKVAPLVQVGIFVSMFLSTAQVPLFVMSGWLHGVARINPVTNILQLGRQGFEHRVTWADTWPGLLALGLGSALFTLFALRGLRKVTP